MGTDSAHRDPSLRAWQRRALAGLADWSGGPYLLAAAPGAGKTRPALVLARELLRRGEVRRVAVVCPTSPLTRQWAQAAGSLGLQLLPDAPELRTTADFHGVAITYARVGQAPEAFARGCGPDTLVIADEAHHLGDDLTWGAGFTRAFGSSPRWLLLSGTPFRSDDMAIPGVRYEDGVAVPDFAYSYGQAIADGVCRRVAFVPYDGVLQWQSGDEVIEAGFAEELATREAGRRYRTAISARLADGLPRILAAAHERLRQVRAHGHRDAGALAIAADSDHAREIRDALERITGRRPLMVLHTEARAAQKLQAFTRSRDEWIVAVNMVSEGVDIPRLRVGVYATAARTPLIFRQIVGRFVRTAGAVAGEQSYLFLPADRVLQAYANDVETELRHTLRPPADELPPEELDGLPERGGCEPGDDLEFVPVSADVAPQMTLFGAPDPAPALAAAATPAPPPRAEPEAAPLYARRVALRKQRHELVSSLSRRTGRSHAEINAHVNGALGVGRVQDASLEQLERSIGLLLDQLSGRATAAAR
ncbi:MAG: DEAD/DEAH box helicase family protein [Thermoleophilaceae bacterium]